MDSIIQSDNKGTYTLLINLTRTTEILVGGIGTLKFSKGLYAYTGSALGTTSTSLTRRIKRHLKKQKKCHWHIDYLLNNEYSLIKAVIYANTIVRYECNIAQKILEINDTKYIKYFGASDCSKGCNSHLHYFLTERLVLIINNILNVYYSCNLLPQILIFQK